MRVIEYIVVKNSNVKNFECSANLLITKGWQPLGNLITYGNDFCQAMVKYKDDTLDAYDNTEHLIIKTDGNIGAGGPNSILDMADYEPDQSVEPLPFDGVRDW